MSEKPIIQITDVGDVSVVSFGVASIIGSPGLEEVASAMRDFVVRNRPKKVVVDFGGVKFFSSQILGLLVDVWKKLGEYGGQLLISGINPNLGRVFKITNLEKIFKFYPDRKSAVEAFGAV